MKYLTIASSGVEDFICISDGPVDSNNLLPSNSKCIRLKTKSSTLEGFCPPIGQKIPKENYITYDETSNTINYYEASANNNCSINYVRKDIRLQTKPKFRYFRVLILYGWSMKNFSIWPWDTSVAPSRDRKGLVPFRYEAWYFEFDSIEDAYAWRNPKPYNLTPMVAVLESTIQSADNYIRGVGYAKFIDLPFSGYLHSQYGLQDIDDENGTKTLFAAAGYTSATYTISGNYTKVRLYEGDFYNSLYDYAYNNYGYQYIALWPLRKQFSTSFSDEEAESVQKFSNLYIAGIEHVLPDRYFAQNPNYWGGGGYWVYTYTLTPSLEKLDSTRNDAAMQIADIYLNWYYGQNTFLSAPDGILLPSSAPNCSLLSAGIPRTLYYNSNGASLFATKNTVSNYVSSPLYSKPSIDFPIYISIRGDIGGGVVRHSAMKFGVSIVYAIQYGDNEEPQRLPSYQFQDVCPPTTIPNSQWILNL